MWSFESKNKLLIALLLSLVAHGVIIFFLNVVYPKLKLKFPELVEISVVGIKTKERYVPETLSKRNYSFTREGLISRNIPYKPPEKLESEVKVPVVGTRFSAKFQPRAIYTPPKEHLKRIKPKIQGKPAATRFVSAVKPQIPEQLLDRFDQKIKGAPARKASEGQAQGKEITSNIIWLTGEKLNRRLMYKPPLEYPDIARRNTIVGKVKLRFKVRPDGSVFDVVPIVKSEPVLTNYAINAVRKYKFEPLPEEVSQIIQEGEILFNFRLYQPE